MANLITLYWRDIPAQVIAERGRGRKRDQAKVELPPRFSVAIDEDTSVNFPMPTFAVPTSTASATLFVVAKNPAPLTTALLP